MCWRNPPPAHTQQGLHSVEYQRAFKNYGENRYMHFVPSSSLREVNGRAPFNCLLGGLQLGAILCSLINNSKYVWNHTSSILQSCAGHSILHIHKNTPNLVRVEELCPYGAGSWDSPSTQEVHCNAAPLCSARGQTQIISWGGEHYLKSRGLGCQPRSGDPMLGHLAKAKLGEPGCAWGFNAHTYTETIKDVWTDMEIRQKLWASLPEMSATGEPGSQHCS